MVASNSTLVPKDVSIDSILISNQDAKQQISSITLPLPPKSILKKPKSDGTMISASYTSALPIGKRYSASSTSLASLRASNHLFLLQNPTTLAPLTMRAPVVSARRTHSLPNPPSSPHPRLQELRHKRRRLLRLSKPLVERSMSLHQSEKLPSPGFAPVPVPPIPKGPNSEIGSSMTSTKESTVANTSSRADHSDDNDTGPNILLLSPPILPPIPLLSPFVLPGLASWRLSTPKNTSSFIIPEAPPFNDVSHSKRGSITKETKRASRRLSSSSFTKRDRKTLYAKKAKRKSGFIVVDMKTEEYEILCKLEGCDREGISLTFRTGRIVQLVAKYSPKPRPASESRASSPAAALPPSSTVLSHQPQATASHAAPQTPIMAFVRRIHFGYDADLRHLRAEFDGIHLRITVPRITRAISTQMLMRTEKRKSWRRMVASEM